MTNPRRSLHRLPPLLLLLALAACGGAQGPGSGAATREVEFDFAPGGPIPDQALADFHVRFECSVGGIAVGELAFGLWPESAPRAVRRFLRHCAEGTYDGTTFHRVVREFVAQGGDPTRTGAGTSPYGVLPPEPTTDPERLHGYGVLSLTEPPSLQFFVCVAESPSVWALDERPVSRVGRLAAGVAALEQIASAEVGFTAGGGERSAPLERVAIDRAWVVRGPAPGAQVIARPQPDLQGQPEVVAVQHALVTFTERGMHLGVNRNRLEARARAFECLQRVRSGELGWEDAVRAYSDTPPHADAPLPVRRISNFGVVRLEAQRARIDASRELSRFRGELRGLLAQGVISPEELARRQAEREGEVAARVVAIAMERREDVNEPAYSEVAFGLAVGEVGLVEYDPYTSPTGWFVVRRIE